MKKSIFILEPGKNNCRHMNNDRRFSGFYDVYTPKLLVVLEVHVY